MKPETLRRQLLSLIENFEGQLKGGELREQVLALIPCFEKLRSLGISLIPNNKTRGARGRILKYLKHYPRVVISGEELEVISGIKEYARRIRELRVQYGWSILSGKVIKQMISDGEIKGIDASSVTTSDYMLLTLSQDREAAYRWNLANSIRRESLSVKDKLLKFFRQNIGNQISGEELRYLAGNKTEWARRVRELRTEEGWPITTNNTGRPDLEVGMYVLEADRQSPTHDRRIPDPVKGEVLRRDSYRCTTCGWNHELWNPSDPRHLELHHVKPHAEKGANVATNLTTLCTICHDEVHRKVK